MVAHNPLHGSGRAELLDPAADNVLAMGIKSGTNTAFTVVKLDSKSGKEVWRQVVVRGFAHTVVVGPLVLQMTAAHTMLSL